MIHVDNRKYTFSKDRAGNIDIYRYGEPWQEIRFGCNAIASMMYELDAARVVLAACRALGDRAPEEIRVALKRHGVLVDDREEPSEWSMT